MEGTGLGGCEKRSGFWGIISLNRSAGAEEAAEKGWNLGEIPENRPSAAKAVLILLDLCTG